MGAMVCAVGANGASSGILSSAFDVETSYSERLMKPPESSLGFLSLVKEFTCRVLLRDGFIYFPCKRFIHFLLVSFDISHSMS